MSPAASMWPSSPPWTRSSTRSTLNGCNLTYRLKGAESPAGLFSGRSRGARRAAEPVGERIAESRCRARIEHVVTFAEPNRSFCRDKLPDGAGSVRSPANAQRTPLARPTAGRGSSSIRMVKCFARMTGDAASFDFKEHAAQRARKPMSGIRRLPLATSGRRPAPSRPVWRSERIRARLCAIAARACHDQQRRRRSGWLCRLSLES